MKFSLVLTLSIFVVFSVVYGRPQGDAAEEKPMPYNYNYKVEDAENSVYFGAQEEANEVGRVDGSYYVWLPDGRLMTVTYYVDAESGFVPKISFEENANPLGTAGKA